MEPAYTTAIARHQTGPRQQDRTHAETDQRNALLARTALEAKTGKSVVTCENFLPPGKAAKALKKDGKK